MGHQRIGFSMTRGKRLWRYVTVGAFCSMALSFGCAGQFELDVPDQHPARASAPGAPIDPAPSPYAQRYPMEFDGSAQTHEEHAAEGAPHETDAEPSSKTGR